MQSSDVGSYRPRRDAGLGADGTLGGALTQAAEAELGERTRVADLAGRGIPEALAGVAALALRARVGGTHTGALRRGDHRESAYAPRSSYARTWMSRMPPGSLSGTLIE